MDLGYNLKEKEIVGRQEENYFLYIRFYSFFIVDNIFFFLVIGYLFISFYNIYGGGKE